MPSLPAGVLRSDGSDPESRLLLVDVADAMSATGEANQRSRRRAYQDAGWASPNSRPQNERLERYVRPRLRGIMR